MTRIARVYKKYIHKQNIIYSPYEIYIYKVNPYNNHGNTCNICQQEKFARITIPDQQKKTTFESEIGNYDPLDTY